MFPAVQIPKSGTGNGGPGSPGSPGGPPEPCRYIITDKPQPVVLTASTILKLALSVILPLIAAASVVSWHYWRATLHMENGEIHLDHGERAKLETRTEARTARDQLESGIKRELETKTREIKADTQRSINELHVEQRKAFKEVVEEVRRTRRAVTPR